MATPLSGAHARAQGSALRRLNAYRVAALDLPDAVREADGQEVDVVTIAHEAGISRGRVYRILGRGQSLKKRPATEQDETHA